MKLTKAQRTALEEVAQNPSTLRSPKGLHVLFELRKLDLVDINRNTVTLTDAGRAILTKATS